MLSPRLLNHSWPRPYFAPLVMPSIAKWIQTERKGRHASENKPHWRWMHLAKRCSYSGLTVSHDTTQLLPLSGQRQNGLLWVQLAESKVSVTCTREVLQRYENSLLKGEVHLNKQDTQLLKSRCSHEHVPNITTKFYNFHIKEQNNIGLYIKTTHF